MKRALKVWLLFLLTAAALPASLCAQIKADFVSDTTKGCAPLIVRFSDRSSGNPVYWRWDLGNGATTFTQNPSSTYFVPGTYSVKLYVRSALSQADSLLKTQYITVYASPVVNFKSTETTGCFPLRVQFSDLSTAGSGTISSWEWDFGDGNTSAEQNPNHTYTALGRYNVTLRIRNSNGCITTLSRENYINLNNGVKADFDLTPPDNCRPPAAVRFVNKSTGTGTLSYRWFFGDGSAANTGINPSHTYNNGGSYSVKLIVQNNAGCIDSLEKTNAVTIGSVKADFNLPSSICVGKPVTLINSSSPTPVSSQWAFGNGQLSDSNNISISFSLPGNYPVKLRSDFGACKDSITKTIQVLPKPVAAFTSNVPGACRGPVTVNFANQSQNAVAYQWLFGDGSSSTSARPTHTYSARGSYNVTLIATAANGCSDTLTINAFVRVLPPALTLKGLTARGCVPYSFTPDYEINSIDDVVNIQWNFGDGSTATGQKPTHVYSNPGTYDLTVLLTTRSGCVDSFRYQAAVMVGRVPAVGFDALPKVPCAMTPVIFQDNTTGDPITEWHWEFGDGRESFAQNPSHIYGDTGFFEIKLSVNSNGCINSLTIPDFIYVKGPVATFVDSSACGSPLTRYFKDSSIAALSWFWDFDDGTTSTEREPVHTFPAPGIYNVTLTVKNDSCEYSNTQILRIIKESPDFTISETSVCKGANVNFKAVNLNRANISSLTWIFGDGVTASLDTSVSHRYTQTGNFSVALAWTDVKGCSDTLRKSVPITVSGPTANFTSAQPAVCTNGTIQFTDLSTAEAGTSISSWTWNYGDGRTETLNSPPFSHLYNGSGNMAVTLRVTDNKGCSDSVRKTDLIYIAKPVAAFTTSDTVSCVNALVTFSNTSTGNPVNAVWNLGDGSELSQAIQPFHRYSAEGVFNISLRITDKYGCQDSIQKPAYIAIRNPRAAFSISDSLATCPPLVSTFTNRSVNYNSFEWDFGDGNRSSLNNPVHFYNLAGTFLAKLIVVSPGGCRDTATKELVVRGPQGDFVVDKNAGCVPFRIKFTATTKDNVSFVWDYNDGTTLATPDSIVDHEFVTRGKYLPRMILIDPQGCRVPITAKDSIGAYGIDANFTTAKTSICDSTIAQFTDGSTSNDLITDFTWNFGDGSSSPVRNPAHIFPGPGNYQVKLKASTLNGCTDEADKPVTITVVANPLISILGDTSVCVPGRVSFAGVAAQADTSLRWNWNFGNNQQQSGPNPTPVSYPVAGSYLIRSIAVNGTGCADTALHRLTVHALPIVNAGPDGTICQGQSFTLRGSAVNYQWSPGSDISCTNCASPIVNPSSTTTYILNTVDQFGCRASDSVFISVKQPFSIQASLGDTLCLGKSLALTARGAEVFTWSPAAGLDNASIANPRATPQTTTTYMVIGRDTKNCFADTAYVPVVVYPYPSVNAGPDQTIQVGDGIPLKPVLSTDAISVLWNPAAGINCPQCREVIASPKATTTYSITATNQGRCMTTDEITIQVICKDGNLFMPNTFSPNGDGNNDLFFPRGKGIYGIKSLKIFNRWGDLVFQQYNFQANDGTGRTGWNGKYKGKDASQDVYVYMIEVICENNQVLFYKGDVTLVR